MWLTASIASVAVSPLKLTKDDVVVFLGGTDMVRAQRSGHLEALLTSEFRNDVPRHVLSSKAQAM